MKHCKVSKKRYFRFVIHFNWEKKTSLTLKKPLPSNHPNTTTAQFATSHAFKNLLPLYPFRNSIRLY